MSPRKARLVADLVRGKSLKDSFFILDNLNKKPCIYIKELILSAFSNAKRTDKNLTEIDITVSKITADGGPILKRFRAASMGRASMIKKRTTHLYVELDKIFKRAEVTLKKAQEPVAKKEKVLSKSQKEKPKKEIKKKLAGAK